LAVAFAGSILALLTPVIIVGGIVGGFFTPTEASVVAALYAMLLGFLVYRSVGPTKLALVLYDTGRFAAIALFCIGTASAFGFILAYFKVPAALVSYVQAMDLGVTEMGIAVAVAFLVIGCFIDAIPAIIILGTVLWPVTQAVGMHPIHFAIIGVISLAFGLVTPPYGLCLLISCAIGRISVREAGDPGARHLLSVGLALAAAPLDAAVRELTLRGNAGPSRHGTSDEAEGGGE
jgi:TRAP-type C4-dicarboxylate transport system permease large subunit